MSEQKVIKSLSINLGVTDVDPLSREYAELESKGVRFAAALKLDSTVDLHDVYAAWLSLAGFIAGQLPSDADSPAMELVRKAADMGQASIRDRISVPADQAGN